MFLQNSYLIIHPCFWQLCKIYVYNNNNYHSQWKIANLKNLDHVGGPWPELLNNMDFLIFLFWFKRSRYDLNYTINGKYSLLSKPASNMVIGNETNLYKKVVSNTDVDPKLEIS